MRWVLLRIIIFVLAVGMLSFADEEYPPKLKAADELFDATLFDQAGELYREVLAEEPALSSLLVEHAKLKLAQAQFSEGRYEECAKELKEKFSHLETQMQAYCLLGLAHQHLEQTDAAIEAFGRFLELAKDSSHPLWQMVQYQNGIALYGKKEFKPAKSCFEALHIDAEVPQNYILAQIYLARIEIRERMFKEAHQRLQNLDSEIEKGSPLRLEWAHVQGEALFELNDYPKAAAYFEQALPVRNQGNAPWLSETLYGLGLCYAKMADENIPELGDKEGLYQRAEKIFLELIQEKPGEKVYLALGQLYVSKGERLGDKTSLEKAEELLSQPGLFSTPHSQAHALFLRVAAVQDSGSSYELLKELTKEIYKDTPYFSQGWFLRGLQDYKKGLAAYSGGQFDAAKQYFSKAALAFQACFEFSKSGDRLQAALCLKYQAQTYGSLENQEGRIKAIKLFDALINDHPELLRELSDPGEIYYLRGLMASYAAKWEAGDMYADLAEASLLKALSDYPSSSYTDRALFTLGGVYYYKKNYQMAEETFVKMRNLFPNSEIIGDALFWAAKSSDAQQLGNESAKEYRRQVYEGYPNSSYAAEAYFTFYPYRDYVQGERGAIKHLQSFKNKYPRSPYLIAAYYLIGMDFKRDRKTAEGKWIRKRNMSDSIEALQQAEASFDTLDAAGEIPREQQKYFIKIRYRSSLERALANLVIADESQGAKKQIYLEYAVDVLNRISHDFNDPDHKLAQHLSKSERYPLILEESTYWLAQAHVKTQDDVKAEKTLNDMLEKYRAAKITRGYFLSRVWYDVGEIAMRRQDYRHALQCFAYAEDAAKGKVLSTDQKIDLWIQQSLCHKELNHLDKAMLILSKAINDDAISGLRLKAMYLRAEIYALQGRQELARKQLEATSKKGGEWALKAKTKLDEEYGFQ